ncbi:hypothetical protein, partial [Methyloglobulus sp.]|uniref:hypothetical protein n=1 Tax=Methyloglobulus sp. TaxID=2518622 RepID=UPI00398A07F0
IGFQVINDQDSCIQDVGQADHRAAPFSFALPDAILENSNAASSVMDRYFNAIVQSILRRSYPVLIFLARHLNRIEN